MGQSLIGRPLYGSRKEEASFADSSLNALTLCLLDSLGVRHAVVGALSALKVNDPQEEVAVCRSEFSYTHENMDRVVEVCCLHFKPFCLLNHIIIITPSSVRAGSSS